MKAPPSPRGPGLPTRGRQNSDKLRPQKARSLPPSRVAPPEEEEGIAKKSALGPAPPVPTSHTCLSGAGPLRSGAGPGAVGGAGRPPGPRGGAPLRSPFSRALSALAWPGLDRDCDRRSPRLPGRGPPPRPGLTIPGSPEPTCLGSAIRSGSAPPPQILEVPERAW